MIGLSPPVVELSGVALSAGDRLILSVGRLEVRAGEILAVIGPNGAGKSTLLRIIGLLESPTAGTVRLWGEPANGRARLGLRRRMASVFQEPLLVDATVFDNVSLGLRFRRLGSDDASLRVSAWLERFGIAPLASRQARTLSGGEAQRCALARALVLDPELLLLDEPFSALDQPTREALIEELGMILRQERITTVFVTHDRSEALALGDRVAVLMGGEILHVDEAARLFSAPATEAIARFVGVETILDGRVVGERDGVAVVRTADVEVEVAAECRVGERVRICLRPEDILLSGPGSAPALTSARNHLAGVVTRLVPAGPHVRVIMECGVPLVALVTRRSVQELGLSEGGGVTASFKATAPHLIRQGMLDSGTRSLL